MPKWEEGETSVAIDPLALAALSLPAAAVQFHQPHGGSHAPGHDCPQAAHKAWLRREFQGAGGDAGPLLGECAAQAAGEGAQAQFNTCMA